VLLAELVATTGELATLYATSGELGPGRLGAALAELGRAKTVQLGELDGLAGALGVPPGAPREGRSSGTGADRGELFRRAFGGERDLAGGYRELAGILAGSPAAQTIGRLATAAARDRRQLRDLYLRYS
jgi:hypothetical protein